MDIIEFQAPKSMPVGAVVDEPDCPKHELITAGYDSLTQHGVCAHWGLVASH